MINKYIDELRTLVNVDSGTANTSGVAKIAAIMQEKYLEMGWHVKLTAFKESVGPGLIATNKPDAEQFDVMLVGHMDTVFPEGTAALRPFSMDGNVAFGPGVADMKSGILSMFYSLSTLCKNTLDRLAILVIMNPDEEIGSVHSHKWIELHAKKCKRVLVFESARASGALVSARKGVCSFNVDFHGVAAHAGNEPQKGRSAVVEMANWILASEKLNHNSVGTTINVGTVNGGTVYNVVPENACASLDIRFWNNSEFEKVKNNLLQMQQNKFIPDVSISLTQMSHRPAMELTQESRELMRIVEEAGTALELPIEWNEVGGGSDANFTSAVGVPTLDGFGPIGGGHHGELEFMNLDSVIPRIQLVQNVLKRI